MGISIKNQRAERLARQLARETGESLTTAISRVLEERLQRVDAVFLSACRAPAALIVTTARLGAPGQAEFDHLLDVFAVEVVAFTAGHAAPAAGAWRRFSRVRHSAGLTILDCCSFALVESTRLPLLAVGTDFLRTEAEVVDLALAGA